MTTQNSPAATPVVTRFPPSPTGKMHLGNARTALFNWLYAKSQGGEFRVRIEDTDRERSTPDNIAFIYEALAWLGLGYDNTPFNQTTRAPEHIAAAKALIASGHAFVDEEGVTRMKPPVEDVTFTDLIQGTITIPATQVEPFALLRSDGTPTYHLGVVCDDAFMGVTHVIRGDDHLNNTPKHILLFNALSYTVPQFAHLPLILGADGEKLSKRHGAASVQDLREAGYLPQAVFNYLMRLGFASGDQEIFSRDEAISAFTLANIHASPARFDQEKLNWYNAHYLRTLPADEVLSHLQPFLAQPLDDHNSTILHKLWPELVQRATTLLDLAAAAQPYLSDVTKTWTDADHHAFLDGHMPLHWHYDALSAVQEWTPDILKAVLDNVVAKAGGPKGGGFKVAGKPLRHALTGQPGGPSLPGIMVALGQTETLRRLKASLHAAHHHGATH